LGDTAQTETGYRRRIKMARGLAHAALGALDSCEVGICLDTGHAHLGEDLPAVVHKLSGHLWMVHASDNHRTCDDHLPPAMARSTGLRYWHISTTCISTGRSFWKSAELVIERRYSRPRVEVEATCGIFPIASVFPAECSLRPGRCQEPTVKNNTLYKPALSEKPPHKVADPSGR
jgi:hypothetical protein